MNRQPILILILISLLAACGPSESYLKEVADYRQSQNDKFSNPETSPLPDEDIPGFEGLEFYPVDPDYRVEARLVLTAGEEPFQMPTTTSRLVWYRKYGEARFELNGVPVELSLYQNLEALKIEKYRRNLFLPFKDLSNGHGSYGGGRYIDLQIPEGETIVIDFNKSYNPYCAYNDKYSCPIPPEANHLGIEIPAGVKNYKH